MKKIILLITICLTTCLAFAEGYQVNVLSAKQTGMGHTGTGMKLGAESIFFNPGALVFMDKNVDLSAGIAGIMAKATYKNGDYKAKIDNPLSTPFYVYTSFKIYDNLAAGIGVNTPYGNALKWPRNWLGSHLIQDISLRAFVFQPTLSYKITDKISIGAGLMIAIGNVNLSRTLMTANDLQVIGSGIEANTAIPEEMREYIVGTIRNNNFPPAKATLDGNSVIRTGFNVGVFYDVSEKVSLGLSYRSKIKMKVKEGDAELTYVNKAVEDLMGTLGVLNPSLAVPKYDQGTFHAELPLPSNTNFGISYRPCEKLELAFDFQYVGWSAYDSLNVYFNEAELGISPIKAEKNYKNTVIARIGVNHKTTNRLDLRAGMYFDQSPIRKNNYNPETPGMNKLGVSVGLSFQPYQNFSIDFAYLYIQGFARDGSYTSPNIVTGQDVVFSGHYKSNASNIALGLSYKF